MDKWESAGWLWIGAGLMLGMGIGFFVDQLVAGLFSGLGLGMIAASVLWLRSK